MRSVLVPVFESDDLAALKNCLLFLKEVGTKILGIVINPNIGITDEKVTEPFDRDIAALEIAERAASNRRDYKAAEGFQQQYEEKKTERDLAIREGWSKIDVKERRKIYSAIFDPFIGQDGPLFVLKENYPKDQIFRALHEMQSQWPKDLVFGHFSVVWPMSVPMRGAIAVPPAVVEHVERFVVKPISQQQIPEEPKKKRGFTHEQRRRAGLRHDRVFDAALKRHGLGANSAPRGSLVEEIIKREFPKAA